MPVEPAALTIRALRKTFTLHHLGGQVVTALDTIDLDVQPGECVALGGDSGAGKSTLLKCIYRRYLPTSGQVLLDNVDLTALDDSALADYRERAIGYVSQFLRPDPRRSALDVVVRAATRRGLSAADAPLAAADALRRFRVQQRLWSIYPTLLSGGEQQRVNLAAATVQPPRLLLLDEPVSALDPANRETVLEAIAALRAEGVTVLSVFHDLDAMRSVSDRIINLRGGRIVDQITNAPAVL